jgi:DNA-binding response OmpR family regulator
MDGSTTRDSHRRTVSRRMVLRREGERLDAVVVTRSSDRWLPRLLAALAEMVSRRPVVVHTLADAEVAVAARGPEVVVFDPSVTGTDFPLVLSRGVGSRCVGWLGSRSSPVVSALLEAGADEVLDASMGDEELVARLRACLSRSDVRRNSALRIGQLHVDAQHRVAEWGGRPLGLTSREVEVLQVLAATHRRPVRREVLYRLVWGWAMPRGDRTVDVNVKRMRDKLHQSGAEVEIRTHPGVGYALDVRVTDEAVTGL